jgi:hypothetical protein
MSDTTKPGDLADKIADGAFGGVTSHRAGYGDKLQRVEDWLRRHPTATLASGEGAVLVQEIDQLRRQIEIFVDMAADWVKVGHENERLQEENDDLRAAIERVRALHQRKIACVGWSHEPICAECKYANGERADYPCSTIKALDGGDA